MNVLPVIIRELRAQARQPFTFWLRMVGVVALLLGGAFFMQNFTFTPNRGGALFGYLHLMLLSAVWILVPLGAADCLSRERREGTLGLLFLTPLKPRDIVVAKGLTHGLRGVTLSFERHEDDEDDYLEKIDYVKADAIVRIQTSSRKYELDVRKVDSDDLKKMCRILKKMNYDQKFQTTGV